MERSARSSLGASERKNFIVSLNRLPPLTEASVHLWTWNLDVDREVLAQLEGVLVHGEWRRVRRCSSHQIARRFIARRGILRRILGLYLDLPPHDVQIIYNDHGKPLLAPDLSPPLQFNLSDSGELAALAVGIGHPLGIDIERLRPLPDGDALAVNFLSVQEVEQFKRAASATRANIFFRLWTRREAISKAEGVGLPLFSDQFSLDDFAERRPPNSGSVSAPHWRDTHLHELTLPAGYIGALATRQEVAEIRYVPLAAACGSNQNPLLSDII